MANYTAHCRSNRFRVKNPKAFLDAMNQVPDIEVVAEKRGFVLLGRNPDGAGWPAFTFNEKTGEHDDLDLFGLVSSHLADGEVAIFVESGHEKLRYLTGYAVAVNNKGKSVSVSIQDIYQKAQKLTHKKDIAQAEY
jgi:hypothetical protein